MADVRLPEFEIDDCEDARTHSRRSAQSSRVEFITRGDRRRVWAVEQKRAIALESLDLGTTPTEVARRYGITSGLLYTWRRQLREGQLESAPQPVPTGFAWVELAAEVPRLTAPDAIQPLSDPLPPAPLPPALIPQVPSAPTPSPTGLIEIALPGGASVRVDGSVDGAALRRVLAALDGLAMVVQQVLAENPFGGAVYAFRGRRGSLLKLLWHDGIGLYLLVKRLERGHFVWPMTSTGAVSLTSAQLATLLEDCEWWAPVYSRRPELAGPPKPEGFAAVIARESLAAARRGRAWCCCADRPRHAAGRPEPLAEPAARCGRCG